MPGTGRGGARIPYSVWRMAYHGVARFRWLSLFILILLLGVIAWGWFSGRGDDTLADIQRRGILRVGLDASFPPFEMIDETGRLMGFDVDIARAIAADLGVEAEFVNIGFDGLYDALLARRVDIIISGLPYDPRWTQDVAYTYPYFNAGQVLVIRADEEAIDDISDLAGRTVAVEWGSQADMEGRRLADEIEGLTIVRQASAAEALQVLFNGQVEAAIVDAVSGMSAAPGGLNIVTYLTDEWYAAAVHIESQALLEAVNESLASLDQGGDLAEIQARWLGGVQAR